MEEERKLTSVIVEKKDGVGIVTLNRPEKANAFRARSW